MKFNTKQFTADKKMAIPLMALSFLLFIKPPHIRNPPRASTKDLVILVAATRRARLLKKLSPALKTVDTVLLSEVV